MASQSPVVQSFDPDSSSLPESLQDLTDPRVQVVALLADPATRESGWAPRAAVALARGLADLERQVLLMDGDAADPALHHQLRVGNGEGVADAVLFGVSPDRIALPHDGGFRFAPAGTVVADPSAVLRHPRWSAVLSQCRDSGLLVLLYLPAGLSGAEGLAGEADRVVRLKSALSAGMDGGLSGVILHPARSTPTPSSERPTAPAATEAAPAGGTTEGEELQEAGAPVGAQAAPMATDSAPTPSDGASQAVPAGDTGSAARPSQGSASSPSPPVPAAAPETPGSRTGFWLLVILLLVALGLVVAALLGYVEIPGITPVAAEASAGVLPPTELLRSP